MSKFLPPKRHKTLRCSLSEGKLSFDGGIVRLYKTFVICDQNLN